MTMRSSVDGRKATIVWRAMHLSGLVTMVGVFAMVMATDAANGIGIALGSFQVALGGFVSVYVNSQGKVDVAETAHGPHPRRSTSTQAVTGEP